MQTGLDDLCVRFIINLPQEDLASVARICFQVEEAQWFYEDFIRPLDPTLPSMNLRSFCLRIFQHCPLLSAFSVDNHMQAFEEFLLYKTRVPVRGAIMLNHAMDSVVLVKGWKKGANWSFPRGKINKDEDDLDCAIREVYEETGYDIREAGLVPEGDGVKYIERTMRDQHMRLYVFRDVPMDTHFEPRTRKEISKIQWYRLSELPAFRKKGQTQHDNGETAADANKFYMVAPFLVPLKKWVVEQKRKDSQRAYNSQNLMPTYPEDTLTEGEQSYQGMESANEMEANSGPGIDTMAGATAALQALLKIQPPTQGLQPEAASAAASPASRNTGEALLAFLQSKPSGGAAQMMYQSAAPPHTPLDHTIINAPIPNTPHHQQPRPPQFSMMPPPPSFPIQQSHGSYAYQQPQFMQQPIPQPNYIQHGQNPQHSYTPPQQELLQRFQPQQIRHPQPLPPQVPRAVFAEGQMHGPMIPQHAMQGPAPSLQHQGMSYPVPQPQFPGVHAPIVSANAKQDPAKLTSHSLALLNAFKTRDQEPSASENGNDLLLRRFIQPPGHSTNPQELSAEIISEMSGDDLPIPQTLPIRPAPTDPHRSSLLSMFKSPTMKGASVVSPPSVSVTHPASLSSETPSATVYQQARSASQDLSSRAESQAYDSQQPSPFKPVSILVRPTQEPAQIDVPLIGPRGHGKGPLHSSNPPLAPTRSALSPATQPPSLSTGDNITKPFQPQILRRPQQPVTTPLAELAAPSPTSNPSFFAQASLDRRDAQPVEHKQNLLSLFGKGPSSLPSQRVEQNLAIHTPEQTFGLPVDPNSRSRVGSLASTGADVAAHASRRSSAAPISPADKGFLLGYLNAVVKDSNR